MHLISTFCYDFHASNCNSNLNNIHVASIKHTIDVCYDAIYVTEYNDM